MRFTTSNSRPEPQSFGDLSKFWALTLLDTFSIRLMVLKRYQEELRLRICSNHRNFQKVLFKAFLLLFCFLSVLVFIFWLAGLTLWGHRSIHYWLFSIVFWIFGWIYISAPGFWVSRFRYYITYKLYKRAGEVDTAFFTNLIIFFAAAATVWRGSIIKGSNQKN